MMNDDRDREDDTSGDLWLTNWEQQCIQHLENEPDYEGQAVHDRDLATQKAWCCFQNSAASIAQLYKDRLQDVPTLWVPFQTAAGTVAMLYKETTEGIRRQGEVSLQSGYQRRNKELLNWARKKRRYIRREDLISYLAGKPLPPRPHHTHRMSPLPRLVVGSHSDQSPASGDPASAMDDNMLMFREALAISGGASRRQRSAELSAFVAGEFARHCQAVKRPMSPPSHDVNMDSPKRPRFI